MTRVRTIQSAVCALLSFATITHASLIDPLDDTSNFGTPVNSTLATSSPGELSITSTASSVDRLVDWLVNGTDRLNLISEGHVTVTPTSQINSGEWGLWALYYTSTGTFLSEANILPFTDSTDVVSIDLSTSAPVSSDEFILRFRVREAVGDGFSFTQIDATPISAVPEPSALFILAPILIGTFLKKRYQKRG